MSTNRTFAPGEKPKLHVYTRNVPELEFRVYRVNDPEKFAGGLAELHSFGEEASGGPKEQIDEKTPLERFHDWKQGLWHEVKDFLREQLSPKTRNELKEKQSSLTERSQVISAAQFAQVPLLNDRQLVARWRQRVPPTYVSDNQLMPVEPLPVGMYLVEATNGHLKAYTLLMVSRMALVTRSVQGEMAAFVVDRGTGEPVAAAVTLGQKTKPVQRVAAGADGLAVFQAPAKQSSANDGEGEGDQNLWVMARRGDDVALAAPWGGTFLQQQSTQYATYAYTDRPVYRPGDTVHFKALLRQRDGDKLTVPAIKQARVEVMDEQQKKLLDTTLPVSAMGSVEGQLVVPAGAALGMDSLSVKLGDEVAGSASFRVEEYRKPEYQVRVSAAKERVLQGESDAVTIDARYFFGEPVANAKVSYWVLQAPHFWWGDADDENSGEGATDDNDDAGMYGDAEQNSEQTGKLDANGKLTVNIPTRFNEKQHHDLDYTVEASVTDQAGRAITGKYRFLATYGSFRVHVEPESYSLKLGDTARLAVTAVDYEGKPVQTRVHVHLFTRDYRDKTETAAGDAEVTTGADGHATAEATVTQAGSITVRATAQTPENRQVQDDAYLWVTGSVEVLGYGGSSDGQLRIITDKKSYAPGETAHVTIAADVDGFHALVTATGYSVEFRKVLASQGRTLAFDLPVTKDSQPNVTVDAVFVKGERMYQGRVSVRVPPSEEQLQVTITPVAAVFQPGEAATYDVMTKDATGKPVAAELSFGVVDEAIYSLYPDTSGDMLKRFYPDRFVFPELENSLTYYFTGEAGLRNPLLAERRARYRPLLAQVKPGNDVVQPKIRKAFPDTALWQPTVKTDGDGRARVTLNFPDSLTTWRATARAITAETQVGSAINRVLVRKNIIVRMGQPRFLRRGDTVTIPVIVHNYLPETKQVTLSLEAQGLTLVNGATQSVTVASKGDATAYYHLRADAVGTATLTAKALSTQESDALQVTLPVEPAGVSESVAKSGMVAGNGEGAGALRFPAGTDTAAHTLSVTVSPSIAGSLFAALDYLTSYPYGCTEQTMSSFLPNVIVAEAMQRLHVDAHVDPAKLQAQVAAGIARLRDYHHDDGGWGWWKEDDSQVFMTAYVVSGLAEANRAGFTQGEDLVRSGTGFLLKSLKDHPRMLPDLRAYVVFALAEAGSVDRGQLDTLWDRRSDLAATSLAYTGLAMLDMHDDRAAKMGTLLEKKAVTAGGLAEWPSSRNELLDVETDNSAESTALALKLLVKTDTGSPLVQQAAQWLVANRDEGSWWGSTQTTAFVLYGLTDYVASSHELSAESDVEVFVNGQSVGKRHFSAADAVSGAVLSVTLPAGRVGQDDNFVRVAVRGNGRTYWSAQGGYYSTAKTSFQRGSIALNLARDYSVLVAEQKDGHMVYRLQRLSGAVKQGDVLAVHLGLTGSAQKYLLVEDPIAAGTEFVKDADTYPIEDRPSNWTDWYTRQEFHDDRAAIFATTFDGRQDSFYLLRVINPGSFEISPARVTPMYQPGVQATTDELRLDVQEVQP